MENQLSCEQVSALMPFYIEDKLSKKLSDCVKKHIQQCPICMEKYEKLKTMVNRFMEIEQEEIEQLPFMSRQYKEFKANLSAYVDNELNDVDNIKIKKIAISNPMARQDLEDIYTFKKLLHNSFDKTKNDIKTDYTKSIMCQLQNCSENKFNDPFIRVTAIFCVILFCIISGFILLMSI